MDKRQKSRDKRIKVHATPQEITENIRIAREHAILGLYTKSITLYNQIFSQIQSHMQTLGFNNERYKWKEMMGDLQREFNAVEHTQFLGEQFKGNGLTSKGSGKQTDYGPNSHVPVSISTPTYNIFIQPNAPRKNPRLLRFGGKKPFAHHQGIQGTDVDEFMNPRQSYDQPPAYNPSITRRTPTGPYRNMGDNRGTYHVIDEEGDKSSPSQFSSNILGSYVTKHRPSVPRAVGGFVGNPADKGAEMWANKRGIVGGNSVDSGSPIKEKRAGWAPGGAGRRSVKVVNLKGTENHRGRSDVKAGGNNKRDTGRVAAGKGYKPNSIEGSKKKTFEESIYGGGGGPDSELINMLERDVVENNPAVTFDDIAELDDAKNTLKEAVLLPMLIPAYFQGIRRPWKGVLMYGPPGTGKTMLARAVATLGKTTFFNISSSSLASKYRGESEKLVRLLFEMARYYSPSTIFFDEIDSIFGNTDSSSHEASRRTRGELLIQMDGVTADYQPKDDRTKTEEESNKERLNKRIIVLAATNRPFDLDQALLRRLEKRIYIGLPGKKGRKVMFEINLKGVKIDDKVVCTEMAGLTDGYSGADIANICREAALMPLKNMLTKNIDITSLPTKMGELERPITNTDFKTAIKNISKTVSIKNVEQFGKWMKQFN